MLDIELGWLAGFMDGEGTVTLSKYGKGQLRCPILSATSTDLELLEEVKRIAGGTVASVKMHGQMRKPAWIWKKSGASKIISLLRELEPVMRCPNKKLRAELLIEHWSEVVHPGGRYTVETLAKRVEFETTFLAVGR